MAGAGAGGVKTAEPLLRKKPPASSPAGFSAVSIATVTRPALSAAMAAAIEAAYSELVGDGALVGGASLDPDAFAAIVRAA